MKFGDGFKLNFVFSKNKKEYWILVQADGHLDNPKCDLDLYKKHLEQAKERNAKIIQIGDMFDVMQGKFDKRSNKQSLKNEFKNKSYFDGVIDFYCDLHKNYKDNLFLLTEGNHESSIKNKNETDLIYRTVDKFNYKHQGNLFQGKMAGWLKVQSFLFLFWN